MPNYYCYNPHVILKNINKFLFCEANDQFLKDCNLARFSSFSGNKYTKFIDEIKNINEETDTDKHDVYFLVPISISIPLATQGLQDLQYVNNLTRKIVNQLKYFKNNKDKHVFFLVGDNEFVPQCLEESIIFQCSCNKFSKHKGLHYSSVIDLQLNKREIVNAEYDILFQCNLGNKLRHELLSVSKQFEHKYKFKIQMNDKFFGLYNDNEKEILQKSFCESMDNSKFVLCPRGSGLSSIRFFETLSFGRIPILCSDMIRLPINNDLYKNFVIFLPELDIFRLDEYIDEFLRKVKLKQSSLEAKNFWQKFFASNRFKNFLDSSLL